MPESGFPKSIYAMFDNWKLSGIFADLPPQRQVVRGLTFTALCLATVIIYEESRIAKIDSDADAERKATKELLKSKDSIFVSFQNRTFNFMEKELEKRFETKYELKELKEELKRKKP